jgi:2-keto-3-deoxy-L-fuconate dehydrogenase
MRLEGKRAFITVAGQGIGRATAEVFARERAEFIATDVEAVALESLTGCTGRRLDVPSPENVTAVTADTGRIDILCIFADYVHHGSIAECDERAWQFSIDLNVTAIYRMRRAFLPSMLAADGGSIIDMDSVASSLKGAPTCAAYGASKMAHIELQAADGGMSKAETGAGFVLRQPMGHAVTVEEIAYLALYRGSDKSSYPTGTEQIVDVGWSI